MMRALREHWPEYLIEAALLGLFMISAVLITALLEYPGSPIHPHVRSSEARRALIGIAMGLTAMGLIYSPWGRRSGAHMNPATTLAFLRLRKIAAADAAFYIAAQFVGGACGVTVCRLVVGGIVAHPSVGYVTTVPGAAGWAVAFGAELGMAAGMMSAVLWATHKPKLAPYTGLMAGTLVAIYISIEAPLSGMSMNPARTFASALPSGTWTGIWIYFTAPFVGMLAAAQLYQATKSSPATACPKLHHSTSQRCIFCGYEPSRSHLSKRLPPSPVLPMNLENG